MKANLPPYAAETRTGGMTDVVIAPRELADYGGDAAIVSWICGNGFDAVGFTCYMWNVERNLRIASEVKKRQPSIYAIAGGPEITDDCAWLTNPNIDTFVTGEGEEAFAIVLSGIEAGAKPGKIIHARQVDPGSLLNPYVSGAISVREGDSVLIETTRGCPFGCTYCFYSKARSKPRHFTDAYVKEFFSYIAGRGVSEVYLLDPSFDSQNRLANTLPTLRVANVRRIPIHTEMNLEGVDCRVSGLMREAGCASVETGLQTVNTRALTAVRRRFDPAKFLRGAEAMAKAGIELRTGIIIGLPMDTIDGFERTCDFITRNSLLPGVEIYPLSVLPGTVLRTRARGFGMEYMDKPPYLVLDSNSFHAEDFLRAREIAESRLGLDLFHDAFPHFYDPGGFAGLIDARDPAAVANATNNPHTLANNCTILFDEKTLAADVPARLARVIREHNPFSCVQLVLFSDVEHGDEVFVRLSDLFYAPDSYVERMHAFDDDNQGRFGTRVFQATADTSLVRAMLEECRFQDPLLVYEPGSLSRNEDFLAEELPPVLIDSSASGGERDAIALIYSEHPERVILFQNAKTRFG